MKVAIYSRKSRFTGSGDSIENQIEMCKNYILSYTNETVEFFIYDDEGFSGKNTDRPEFKKMINDAKARKFTKLICYRLDRVSRNIADFSNFINKLQDFGIDFISINEQFDTSTPMGRAMMYIASVFAQLERETIADRVRDNMLELAKSGRWLGGQTPLGFNSEKIIYLDNELKERTLYKLSPVDEEMNIVKLIYNKYLETNSVSLTVKYLISNNIRGKKGGSFAVISINDILRNPVYVKSNKLVFDYLNKKGMNVCGKPNGNGILVYNKRNSRYKSKDISEWIAAVSNHTGVISADEWISVQNNLDKSSQKRSFRQGTSKKSLLSGLLKCAKCGSPMKICYGSKNKNSSERIYYYTCTLKAISGKMQCSNPNVRGDLIEQAIIDKLKDININDIVKELSVIAKSSAALLENVTSDINKKTNEMNLLISKLCKISNLTAADSIISKIENLGKEIDILKLKISEDKESNITELKLNNILESRNSLKVFFNDVIYGKEDERSLKIKKYLLESIIDEIMVDGESKKVEIKLCGS